jgi:type II secretory pathway pseudopilin PulG
MSRLRAEHGFTLMELMVSSLIGIVVLMGALTILESSQRAQARTSDRSEAIQRGRTAIEQLVQALRSEVCIGAGSPAIVYGDNTHVTFIADLKDTTTDANNVNNLVPAEYDIAYANGSIVEKVYPGTPDPNYDPTKKQGSTTPYLFATTPSVTRTVLDKMTLQQSVPLFKYYSFNSTDPITPSNMLGTPLADTDRDNVVQIQIAFKALASRRNNAYAGEPFTSTVFVRTADPTDPQHSPLCF